VEWSIRALTFASSPGGCYSIWLFEYWSNQSPFRRDVELRPQTARPVLLVLVDAVAFLNTVDQHDVRLPVVKYLPSQRASSIQALAIYLMVVRLVLINRTSFNNADRWATPKNQMRSCETDFGQGFTNRH
jgi:hypothetical protein